RFLVAAGAMALAGCQGGAGSEPPREAAKPGLGAGASLGARRIFPPDNAWNRDVSKEPVDPDSDTLVASIGTDRSLHPDFGTVWEGSPLGIPYVVVPGDQPRVPVRFVRDDDESDPGPYPVPPDAPVEGGRDSKGDRHVLILDRDNWKLYEMIGAYPDGKGWKA